MARQLCPTCGGAGSYQKPGFKNLQPCRACEGRGWLETVEPRVALRVALGAAARAALEREKANEALDFLFGTRAHHQACPVGGLHTGRPCDLSGMPCWCGATTELLTDEVNRLRAWRRAEADARRED